jgi:hypothetical protein
MRNRYQSAQTQAEVPFVYQIEAAKQQKRFREEQKKKDAEALAKQKEKERLADLEKTEMEEEQEAQEQTQLGLSAWKYGQNLYGDDSAMTFGDVGKKIGGGISKVTDWFGGGDTATDYSGVGAGEGFIEGMDYASGWSPSAPSVFGAEDVGTTSGTGLTGGFGGEDWVPDKGGITPGSEGGLFSGLGEKLGGAGKWFSGLDIGNAFAGGAAGFGAAKMFSDKSEKTKGLIGAGAGALMNVLGGGGISGALSGGLFGGVGGLFG